MAEILFFEANTSNNDILATGREIRTIEEKLREVSSGSNWRVTPVTAVRPEDWRLRLNTHHPDIVHFSGHGSELGKLLMVGEMERAQAVSPSAFKDLFRVFKGKIRLAVLNACNSSQQAQAISEEIDCTIGMDGEISDNTSIAFVAALYQGLKLGHSVRNAFEQAKLELQLRGLKGDELPRLFTHPGIDASQIWLVDRHLRQGDMKVLSIFYVYVPEDKGFCVELEKLLSIIRLRGLIRSYYGQDLRGGDVERETVMQQLRAAQVILLIVSPDLIASPLYQEQLEPSWELRAEGVRVIPIIVKPVPGWGRTKFGGLVSLPRGKKSVWDYGRSNRSTAVYEIANDISSIVESFTENP
jgi:hypothetical protein